MMKDRDINCETYNENKGISTDGKAAVLFDKDVVEKAIVNFLQETIAPALHPYADVLIQQCKEAIEKVVTQGIIERVEAEVHIENRERIFERVQQRLKDKVNNNFPILEISKAEAVERAKLIQKWIDGIGDIKEEDEELSAIWEGWFVEMNKDVNTTDQKRALEIMKTLSAEEAKLMLEIKERGYIRFLLFSKALPSKKHYHSQKEKMQYLVNQLLKRELIVKTSVVSIMTIAIILGVLSYAAVGIYFLVSEIREFYSHTYSLPITIIATLFISTLASIWLFQKRYRLTWIGEKIVSYAKKNKERSEKTPADN